MFVVQVVATDEFGESASGQFQITVWDQAGTVRSGDVPGIVPALRLSTNPTSGRYLLSFERSSGMTHFLQVTTDLVTWQSADARVYRQEIEDLGNGQERVTLELQVFGNIGDPRFYRVVVQP